MTKLTIFYFKRKEQMKLFAKFCTENDIAFKYHPNPIYIPTSTMIFIDNAIDVNYILILFKEKLEKQDTNSLMSNNYYGVDVKDIALFKFKEF